MGCSNARLAYGRWLACVLTFALGVAAALAPSFALAQAELAAGVAAGASGQLQRADAAGALTVAADGDFPRAAVAGGSDVVGDARAAVESCAFTLFAQAADEAASIPFETADGWRLAFHLAQDGHAVLDGVVSAGSGGALEVPASVEGHDVTEIATRAFYSNDAASPAKAMTSITLPPTLETLGAGAFMATSLASISLPASVSALPERCFAGCRSLQEVVFEGETLGSIGDQAFSGCNALVRLDIPELTSRIPNKGYRIGRSCFYLCTKLETIVFRGNALTESANYISNSDCFDNCPALKNLVYYCKRSAIPRATSSDSSLSNVNEYETMWFYANADDAKAGKGEVYRITVYNQVKLSDVVAGTVKRDDVLNEDGSLKAHPVWDESGTLPELPAGKMWGVSDGAAKSPDTLMSDTHYAAMVDPDDLTFGFVTSPTIEDYRKNATSTMGANDPKYYLDDAGTVTGLSDLQAYGPGSNKLAASAYKIVYQKRVVKGSGRDAYNEYETLEGPPTAADSYRLRAEGASATNAGTYTDWVYISVVVFTPTVKELSGAGAADRLAQVSQLVSSAAKEKARCAVVVPANDWRYQLIGAGLAGAAKGTLLFDGGDDYSPKTVTAFVELGVSAVQVVGSTSAVPESKFSSDEAYLMDYLDERGLQYKARYSQDATVQGLADQAYYSIRSLMDKSNTAFGDGWGDTAIIASPSKWRDVLGIAQVAYELAAPVFFVGDDGLLSSADLDYLKGGGFQSILVAGDATYVSQACVDAVASATGIAPERLFASGDDTLGRACASAAKLAGTLKYAIAVNADSPADSVAAAVFAGARGGVALPCACTADSKRIQDVLRAFIRSNGQTAIETAYLVGDFANVDPGLKNRIQVMWEKPLSTKIGSGDTVVSGDFAFTVSNGAKAVLSRVRDTGIRQASIAGFRYGGASYTVASIASGAFSNCSKLESVTIGNGVTGIGTGAFSGCAALSKVALGTQVASVGARSFSGCASLASVTGARVNSIGASAFEGCAKLRTCAPLKTAAAIGASAFAGCKALTSAGVSAAKTVGASAFKGCSQVKAASLPKATTVGKRAFEGCKALKALNAPLVKTVGASAFSGCSRLGAVSLPKATSVAASAFAKCAGLKRVVLPKALAIGAGAFSGCSKLGFVQLSAPKLSKVGKKAFFGCKKLSHVNVASKKLTASRVGTSAFKGLPRAARVLVPKARAKAYAKLFVKRGLPKSADVKAM